MRRVPALTRSATAEFQRWSQTLNAERRAKVSAALARIAEGGPTLGRPRVDVIHGSRVHKLKEARVDRGTRVLFAFDSHQNAVMLLGGDKTGKWNAGTRGRSSSPNSSTSITSDTTERRLVV